MHSRMYYAAAEQSAQTLGQSTIALVAGISQEAPHWRLVGHGHSVRTSCTALFLSCASLFASRHWLGLPRDGGQGLSQQAPQRRAALQPGRLYISRPSLPQRLSMATVSPTKSLSALGSLLVVVTETALIHLITWPKDGRPTAANLSTEPPGCGGPF